MNILMITNTYAPIIGGLEKSIQVFSARFRKLGHKVIILAPAMKGILKKESGVLRIPASQIFGMDFPFPLSLPAFLEKLIDSFRPDIVHAHHPFLAGDLALRLCGQYRLPLIYTHHTLFGRYEYRLPLINNALKRFLMKLSAGYANLADRVIAPSESVRRILVRHGVRTPIEVIPTGIPVQNFSKGNGAVLRKKFKIPQKAFVIGYAGRLSQEKNLGFLTNSVARFIKKEREAYFLIVGEGPSHKTVRSILKRAGLENRLCFTGALRGKALSDGYQAMDLFVFASKSETQGLVILEAMAGGIPVIALDAPGVREILKEGKNGYLVPAQNEKAFAGAIDECFSLSGSKRNKMGQAARKTAEQFSVERMANHILRVYRLVRKRKCLPSESQKSHWRLLKDRIRTEWRMLANITKAAGAGFKG